MFSILLDIVKWIGIIAACLVVGALLVVYIVFMGIEFGFISVFLVLIFLFSDIDFFYKLIIFWGFVIFFT